MCPMDVLGIFMHTSYKYNMIYDSIYFSKYLIYNYIIYIDIIYILYIWNSNTFLYHQTFRSTKHRISCFPRSSFETSSTTSEAEETGMASTLLCRAGGTCGGKSPLKTWLQSMDFSENLGDKPEKISPHVFIIMPFKLAKMRGHTPFSDKTIC